MFLFFVALIACVLTTFLAYNLSALAYRFGILDHPNTAIKKHTKSTPYLGGVAVYLSFLIVTLSLLSLEPQPILFFIGLTVLLLVGLIDDLVLLKPFHKLIGQAVASLIFLCAQLYIPFDILPSYASLPLSFIWFLTLSNAFNLIDIMDGLATTVSLTSSLFFLIIALLQHASTASFVLAAFMGSLAGFLVLNKPRAQMYLGDAGSLFIGGFLSAQPFFLHWGQTQIVNFLIPILFLFIPLVELGMLIVIRTYKGIPFYLGSRDHFAHFLLDKRWSVVSILIFIFLTSSLFGALGVAYYLDILTTLTFLLSVVVLLVAYLCLVYKTI